MSNLFGSICLSDIPREVMKKVMCKDGVERVYLNISIGAFKEPKTFNDKKYTHYVSCAPKNAERKEGVNYYLGNLQTWDDTPQPARPTPEEINQAPSVGAADELPF